MAGLLKMSFQHGHLVGEEGPGGEHDIWCPLTPNLVRSTQELVEENAVAIDLWRQGLPAGCGDDMLPNGLEGKASSQKRLFSRIKV